ncbi:hypothetical protein EJ03DRAFT_59067 [Teratosphaeria nubilosa]|uniref:Uncharacterized protein n=1 Tax=Teratosphaeria nubilosa TaxID=161662 RepID=A0A6G1KSR1_9PEZI|nr:hypothetical protein EJ03DRAFT_59067 [Teratosphaeria nubilosa]
MQSKIFRVSSLGTVLDQIAAQKCEVFRGRNRNRTCRPWLNRIVARVSPCQQSIHSQPCPSFRLDRTSAMRPWYTVTSSSLILPPLQTAGLKQARRELHPIRLQDI